MSEWFIINDIDEFTDKARAIVYNNFGVSKESDELDVLIDDIKDIEKEELEKVLSHQESLTIVKDIARKQKHKKNNEIRYILNDKLFATIVEDLNSRMVSNILNGLVKKGLVETAYDNETNDFVFWVNDKLKDSEEKPETD